jgi:hypothetical protein
LYYTALHNYQGMVQKDSKDSKDVLDFRPVSDDGNTLKLIFFTFFYNFEKS